MFFNSFDFLIFFSIVFILFYIIPYRFRWILLLLTSYFFYMYWNPLYIVLILLSTGIDYFISHKINGSTGKKRKQFLLVSLISNLGLLFIFKYFNFFSESFSFITDFFGSGYEAAHLDLILPVGISFYTFQTLSYSIDVYRGKLQPEKHLGKFALYVAFFPQLVAGPIERATNLLPQFENIRSKLLYSNFSAGLLRILYGLFKKVVVADTIAIYVNSMYGGYQYQSGITMLLATYLFAFQIYCDFSGYSDIAIGTARMLGFSFMENFKTPYFSKSITEFWRRWHISLSSWLRDYLYIPVGGNKKGEIMTYRNLFITMLLGGLWHGASWNFVIWGALNGLYLAFEKYTGIHKFITGKSFFAKLFFSFITFNLISFTWIFFRADTITESLSIVSSIFTDFNLDKINFGDLNVFVNILFGLIVLIFLDFIMIRRLSFDSISQKLGLTGVSLVTVVVIISLLLFGVSSDTQFIYFQF